MRDLIISNDDDVVAAATYDDSKVKENMKGIIDIRRDAIRHVRRGILSTYNGPKRLFLFYNIVFSNKKNKAFYLINSFI